MCSSSITLYYSSSNILLGNSIANSGRGIELFYSNSNTLLGNSIANSYVGIKFGSSIENSIYHNNFIKNDIQVNLVDSSANIWDDGYPSGGNYWSDYTGVDQCWGPNQNQTGSDGIGDTSRSIDPSNVDHYPLMNPWPSPRITVRVETSTGTGLAGFTPSSGVISTLAAVPEDSLPMEGKPNLEFPHGLFSFTIIGLYPGQEVEVTITLPTPLPIGSQYWKCQDGIWYPISLGSDDGDNIITITLKDGGLGDGDGAANRVIRDPGGPGCIPPPVGGVIVEASPEIYTNKVILLAVVMASIAWASIKLKRLEVAER
jgi:parallel beta-helix repeat protein